MAEPQYNTIDKFLGVNKSETETLLQLGEASEMSNWIITDDRKLKKVYGYESLNDAIPGKKVNEMWEGLLNGKSYFLAAINGYVYCRMTLSDTNFDSLDDSTYTNVDTVKTTALTGAISGTTGIDDVVILRDKAGTQLEEVAAANIDLEASIGKFYYDTDKKINLVIEKGTYADIAAARTGLGTMTGFFRIGAIKDAYPTTFFVANNTVYILDGTEFYSWDGTVFQQVSGYVPTVVTAAPPYGGGTLHEGINYINGKKNILFSADGESTVYQLQEDDIDSVDSVRVGVTEQEEGTDYSVNLIDGEVVFIDPPPVGSNNVAISYTKADADMRKLITNCRYYGGSYYARFWLFGNPNRRNTRFPSGVTVDGVSDPTYWPYATDSDVGEYEITDILTQYDKQIIFTSGDSSGASAWYSLNETYTDPGTSLVVTLFPTFPINAKAGNVAPGQAQLILNNPFTIWNGVYQWTSTYVMNEKDVRWVSQRIQRDLDALDLTKAITWDWHENGLYLLCIGKKVWVYNYRVDVWYVLELPHEPTCFMTVDKKLLFGTTDGQIMRFDESLTTFDGKEIVATWDMGYSTFGVDYLRKYIQIMFISLLPYVSTHVDIYLSTDRNAAMKFIKTIQYGLSNFDTWDFSNFSFQTNFSPQPKKVKLKAKKIDYLKIRLVCGGDDPAAVLSLTLPIRAGGLVKNK